MTATATMNMHTATDASCLPTDADNALVVVRNGFLDLEYEEFKMAAHRARAATHDATCGTFSTQKKKAPEIFTVNESVFSDNGSEPECEPRRNSSGKTTPEAQVSPRTCLAAQQAQAAPPAAAYSNNNVEVPQQEMIFFDPNSGNYFKVMQCNAPYNMAPQQMPAQPPQMFVQAPPMAQVVVQPQLQQIGVNHFPLQQQPVADAAAAATAEAKKCEQESKCTVPEHLRTTVMIRNIPNQYSREQLEVTLNEAGYFGLYDFLYLPMDFVHQANVGYAFVNLLTAELAHRFMAEFPGFNRWSVVSTKVTEVCWSLPNQGLEAHIERYRNSPVMHSSMPDSYRPRIYAHGQPIPFPEPTKVLKPPKVRPTRKPVPGSDYVGGTQ